MFEILAREIKIRLQELSLAKRLSTTEGEK